MILYGSNPKFLKHNKGNRKNVNRQSGPRGSPKAFDEARHRNEFHKFGAANFKPTNLCEKGKIIAHTRNILKEGKSSIHIVEDLVHQIQLHLPGSGSEETPAGKMYGDAKNKVTEFDALVLTAYNYNGTRHAYQIGFVEPIEVADQEIYMSLLAAAMEGNDISATSFRQGDLKN